MSILWKITINSTSGLCIESIPSALEEVDWNNEIAGVRQQVPLL